MEGDRWLIYDEVQVEREYEQNRIVETLLFAFPVFVTLQCRLYQHSITQEKKNMAFDPVSLADPDEILTFLSHVALRGKGMTTESLMDYVLDEGFTEPTYLSAKGEDSQAFYQGQPNAWAVYQIREWKRVLVVSGGGERERRVQITETP